MSDFKLTQQNKWLILLGTTLLSAILRLVGLNQIPPGLWFDEAWVAVVARDWGNELYYAATWGGMHPAIVYLTKIGYLFSNHPLTIRYVVALVGTLTVPLAYFSTRPLFKLAKFGEYEWLSLLTAVVLSITYPFFHFSRLGFESILPAPFSLVAFGLCAWLIQRQLHGPNRLDPVAVALGGWLGLTIYTFDTARFIPIAIALAITLAWFIHRDTWPLAYAFATLTLITLVAIMVAAPLLRYFWLNWDTFIQRAEVTTFNTLGAGADSVPLALLRNTGRTLGGLFIPGWGDKLARHNLPGRPVFDFILGFFFLAGCVSLFFKKQRQLAPILLSWLIITLLPVILTDDAPTYTRIFGAIPALAIMVTLGLDFSDGFLPQRMRNLVPVLLVISACLTGYDYFVRWPIVPAYFNDFKTVEWDVAQRTLVEQTDSAVFFTPRREYLKDPTYDLLLSNSSIRPLPNSACLQYRPNETATYVLSKGESEAELDDLKNSFGAEALLSVDDILYRSDIDIIGRVVEVEGRAPSIAYSPPVVFGQDIQLMGHEELRPSYSAGELIDIAFHWQAGESPISTNYILFAHLYAAGDVSAPLAQFDGPPCVDTSTWLAGDVLIDHRQLQVPADLPAGEYLIAIGWYNPFSFERLELTDQQALQDHRLPFWKLAVK